MNFYVPVGAGLKPTPTYVSFLQKLIPTCCALLTFVRIKSNMTDTHCHLDYCQNLEQAVDSTLTMISIGTNLKRSKTTLKIAERYDNVFVAIGIHPTDADEATDPNIRTEIEELARHPKVVGIGETGFDFYWDKTTADVQRKSFLWQAELASKLEKPLILHVRDKQNSEKASLETKHMLEEVGYSKGILHCCNGHKALVETGLELGWYVSFAGNLTYKKATLIQDVAKELSKDRILLETDSPFLTPIPKRGEKNIPANVHYTARFLAELRNESFEEVESYTDKNAKIVYGLTKLITPALNT